MHPKATELIEKINELSKDTPIIYFARDAERALGLENKLENYHIVCIEQSYLTDQLIERYPERVFCTEAKGIKLENQSTLDLVNNNEVQDWLRTVSKGREFYALFFQFNKPAFLKLQSIGGKILNNSPELNRMFEDKISQFETLTKNNIVMPKGEVVNVSSLTYQSTSEKYGTSFVAQLDRGHTGSGTFIINNESDFTDFKKIYDGNLVKITQFIPGEPYTVNACITDKDIFINGLQYQITGLKELTPGRGSTVGNDWSYANGLAPEQKSTVFDIVKNIGELMKDTNYRGLFGVDLIIKDSEILVIEINARQAANISLQTKLELSQEQVPLLLIHMAQFLGIELDFIADNSFKNIEGSQIFLRAKVDNTELKYDSLYSGIYRLQSDNSALNWSFNKLKMTFKGIKPKVIFIDEDKDKPLIWQNDGYSIDQITKGGFVLLVQNKSSIRNKFEELARMQFKNQIVYNDTVSPWVIEAMLKIERSMK